MTNVRRILTLITLYVHSMDRADGIKGLGEKC